MKSILILIFIQAVLGFLATLNIVNVAHFHGAAAKMKAAYDNLCNDYEAGKETGWILGETVQYTEYFLSTLPIYRKLIKKDPENFKEASAELIDYFIENRENLFGVKRGDLWNFAVYLYHHEKELLLPVWRKAAPTLWNDEQPRPIRAFGRCDGHVGAAFRRNKPIITVNAHDPAIKAFTELPDRLRKDDDSDQYTSFASFPLESGNDVPNGVLVVTNNQIGTFTPKNCIALRSTAHFLSQLSEKLDDAKIEQIALQWTNQIS